MKTPIITVLILPPLAALACLYLAQMLRLVLLEEVVPRLNDRLAERR